MALPVILRHLGWSVSYCKRIIETLLQYVHLESGAPQESQGIQKSDQLLLFFCRQIHLEPLVVEIDKLLQIVGSAVMEIGRAGGQSAQNRSLAPVHVAALARDQRFAG